MFIRVCRAILQNPSVNPVSGIARHASWHAVRRLAPLPLKVRLTDKSALILRRREELNGCVALAWSQRLYSYHNMMFLRTLVETGFARVCFDVGANIGIYSLLMSETPAAEVHAFEPHPGTCATLRQMVESNGRANVQVWQRALSDTTGGLLFTNDDCCPANHAIGAEAGADAQRTAIEVPCETGRDFCARQQVTPDILKIDTEGLEPRILRGFGDVLRQTKLVMAEMNVPDAEVAATLPPDTFVGPCHVDVLTKTLTHTRRKGDDALFINCGALPALHELGYRLV